MSKLAAVGEELLINTLEDLLRYAERNTCLHEETHRGGSLWTICDSCGMKWADDEGGKPTNAHEWPEPIAKAQDVLDIINKAKKQTNDKTSDTVSIVIPNAFYTGVV